MKLYKPVKIEVTAHATNKIGDYMADMSELETLIEKYIDSYKDNFHCELCAAKGQDDTYEHITDMLDEFAHYDFGDPPRSDYLLDMGTRMDEVEILRGIRDLLNKGYWIEWQEKTIQEQ